MDHDAYLAGLAELYAAEVLGEGLASRWLELTSVPDQRYKLELFLQLESEAKVRLRPLLARRGLSLVEDDGLRAAGAAVAEKFAAVPWKSAMAELAVLARPYLERFQTLLDAAPAEDVPWVSFMVDHEASVIRMAQREAEGAGSMEHDLLPMLLCPMARAVR
ncbi:MAG TPA: hypothetical protein VKG63_19675 [Steroidobacteraceae bacterium]|nr:hypothetical protein [Steroidobacteraceae bacterium]